MDAILVGLTGGEITFGFFFFGLPGALSLPIKVKA
jgi:hypothetical protein